MNGEARKTKIYERLQALAAGGRLTAEVVLADAKKKNSPLHGEFEWDDSVAGRRYRLDQARSMIASVKVYIERRTMVIAVPVYTRDPDAESKEQGYRSTATLKTDRERARDALISEAGRAAAYMGRVRALSVALDMEDEVDEIIGRFAAFRMRAEVSA